MAETPAWDQRLLSIITTEFDRALLQLRRDARQLRASPNVLVDIAIRLQQQPGMPRREFDRRFRLIVGVIAADDTTTLRAIVDLLRETSPEALNAVRTLLPPEMRHVALPAVRSSSAGQPAKMQQPPDPEVAVRPSPSAGDAGDLDKSKFGAVALVGTAHDHARNEPLLVSAGLTPLRLPSLDQLWEIGPTGLCGFVVAGSAWARVPESDQRRAIRRICEYSTFLFTRVCVDGLFTPVAQTFSDDAKTARCGIPDGQKFCQSLDCDLTPADIGTLRSIASFLQDAGTAAFFPLGLSEPEASILRLIATDRRHPENPLTIKRLGTRELAGGRSKARVFLLNDGANDPFVVKIDESERLVDEIKRYQRWIQHWEPNVTSPAFHTHLGSAALSYRLQPDPDGKGTPAPTLDDRLESLRAAEWTEPIETTRRLSDDLLIAVNRAVDSLVKLNSRASDGISSDEFWIDWPARDLAARGIEISILDQSWRPMAMADLVSAAMATLGPGMHKGVVHGDIHGRNILIVDRLPAFIDFAWSGPGHPLVDIVRLDAAVRTAAMRMILDKRSMHDAIHAIYVDGVDAESVLAQHATIAASPSASLAIRTAVKCRAGALAVAGAHSLGPADFLAMTCVVSAFVLTMRQPGSGIERLILSVVGPAIGARNN